MAFSRPAIPPHVLRQFLVPVCMFPHLTRRAAILISLGGCLLLLATGAAAKLIREVRRAYTAPLGSSAPLAFLPVPLPTLRAERWGGGEVRGVVVTPEGLITAGAFGVRDDHGDLGQGLPTLQASGLCLWRGAPVVALSAGGVFLRRGGAWEEMKVGFGTLHVRALLESSSGELYVGAREGLFRAAWAARAMDRLDTAPVQTLAFAPGGGLWEGGETGLRLFAGGRLQSLATPDPWIQWVGVQGQDLVVLTPLGLARGPLGGALAAVPGAGDTEAATILGDSLYALEAGRLLHFAPSGQPSELALPVRPRRMFVVAGDLLVDTDTGLYRRAEGSWVRVRPWPDALPPGSSHIGALARFDGHLAVGLFDGGLVVGDPPGPGPAWYTVQDPAAWGVNALLPLEGALYVASLRGAARFDGHRLVHLGEGGGAVFSLADTTDGVVIGYGQGVALPGSRFLTAFHGLPGNQALALATDPDGLLFVGTPSGLGAVRGARVVWRLTSGDGKLPHPWVTALARFGDALYVGTYGGGLAKRTAAAANQDAVGAFDPFVETEGLKVSGGCLVVAQGTLLAGTDGQGLFRLSRDGSRFLSLKVPLPSPHITAILSTPDGLYVGTDEGLARIPLPLPSEGG